MIGLPPFLESGSESLRGREADRDALLRMLSKQWVRAGLLVGEPGVGKTAFLRREVVPHLSEGGGVVLFSEDGRSPTRSFAAAVATVGYTARPGESELDLLTRAVETASGPAQWTFIYDDLDLALSGPSGKALANELAELLARVCPRPGGRTRFLFSASDTRLHACDALERLVGPLFAVTCRNTLPRLGVPHATEMLADALSAEGLEAEPEVRQAVLDWLASDGSVLPAHVRIMARALRQLGVRTEADLVRRGGPAEIPRRWILASAYQTESVAAAMRVLGELAAASRHQAVDVEELARRAGVGPGLAGLVVQSGIQSGLCARLPGAGTYALAHEVLIEPVRDATAPDLERAQRARRALSAAARRGGRVSWREWWQIRHAKVSPTGPAEEAALGGATRFFARVGIILAAVPLLLLLLSYFALWGRFHLAIDDGVGGGRVHVRAGRPDLAAFHWLPHRPAFGSLIADPGIAEWMAVKERWESTADAGGSLDDQRDGRAAYVTECLGLLRTPMRSVLDYLLERDGAPVLAEIEDNLEQPEEWVEVLDLLAPVARGGKAEEKLLMQALSDRRHEVRAAALATAAAVEERRSGLYHGVLADAVASQDATLARRARALVLGMPEDARAAIAAAGAARAPDSTRCAQLLEDMGRVERVEPGLAAHLGAALLEKGDVKNAKTAWKLLERAFGADAAAGVRAAARLIGASGVDEAVRIRAIEMVAESGATADDLSVAADAVSTAAASGSLALRTAALPFHARVSPKAARPLLDGKGRSELRAAQALAWGELLATDTEGARAAVERLLKDGNGRVRASAARAYGRLGRPAQGVLVEMVKQLGVVGEGAAWGLAESVDAGGSLDEALMGIGRLWSKKGAPKRAAARVYAHMARTQPEAVRAYLTAAARDGKDPELRRTGVEGLCIAHRSSSSKDIRSTLISIAAAPYSDARARIAACVAEHPEPVDTVIGIAARLRSDSDGETRRQMARALAAVARRGVEGREARDVVDYLADLSSDRTPEVRGEALAGLAHPALGPLLKRGTVGRALRRAWERSAGERDKLAVLDAVQATGKPEVMGKATLDRSPRVRARAIDGMAKMDSDLRGAVERGLADEDVRVRRAAVRALSHAGKVARTDAVELLETALGDDAVAGEALVLYARLESPKRALGRLEAALAAPSERDRSRAARAASALILRDVAGSRKLLEKALGDPARDVRLAALEALSVVDAKTNEPGQLASLLAGAERDAMRRLLAARALVLAASTKEGRAAVEKSLGPIAKDGPPLAKLSAEMVLALLRTEADGPAFLSSFVP